ncbi:phenylalanine--tRNA ligase subunit alpha [Thermosediminibacter litoriperuensis]|uniref:Phenylalanine--tRNA ligase alpha subunit n=1 Tax=Thermosediminibacter litoriperuensis TaxID=291989 RepID=A0A5S5AI22_9FIRM|nr:phenylalanine--tRNA ligase subunit alpha [Thermosediminibacter litoriperuensis]TYP49817.1 phenylalanyl-tRNA synthetase alpha subunit [Thermosediminibacter litoriperuensis]
MKQELINLKEEALRALETAGNLEELNDLRIKFLGKKGKLTVILRGMADLKPEERPAIGKLANEIKEILEEKFSQKSLELKEIAKKERLKKEAIDVTIPSKVALGHKHPLTLVLDEIKEIFLGLGYEIVEGPEIELDYYNFEALNIPKDHPARDMQDTFYITEDILLRTHTSPVQIRTMENRKPPIKVIVPGRVYRSDEVDATHSPVFHQVEGLLVGKNVTMAQLKGTLITFAKLFYGEERMVRFRPSYFPFTEPSAEMDISCIACNGKGCRVCSYTGWLEILGCGMVHPNVLKNAGYDPEELTGFAFGMGIERIAMLKYGINDMRLFFENDLRFLEQF